MRKPTILLCGILVCGLAPTPCIASRIALETSPATVFSKGKVRVNVDVTNKGNEPAMSVQMEASVANCSSRSETKESLGTNETFHAVLDLGDAPQPPGIYTVVIKVHYTDANGYPSTALRSIPLVTAEPRPPEEPVSGRLSSAKMRKCGEIVLLASQDPESDTTVDARVSLVLPEDLECPAPQLNVSIPRDGEKRLSFQIHNLWGRRGSRYSIFAIIDYLQGGQHRSLTARSSVVIKGPWRLPFRNRAWWLALIIPLLALFLVLQFFRPRPSESDRRFLARLYAACRSAICNLFPFAVLIVLLLFTLYHIPPSWLLLDTVTTGGDTPAHNYLASHLKEQLLGHGRIVSWAGGWWCGFPMFQYYFCLPYLLVSLLSFVMPFNVAFKLVSVLGIFALPVSAYASARMMRLPRPVPTLLAIAMVAFLFDRSHTMWGGNIYSTFAGMISNSISFPIMLFFIASAYRDSNDGQFRFRTVFLLAVLISSHFFTSVIACLTLAILPFLHPEAGARKAVLVLAKEYGLGLLLMAWWLIPLVVKQQYSVDFGVNWKIAGIYQDIRKHINIFFISGTMAFAVAAVAMAAFRRVKFVPLISWMFMSSVFLFFFGYRLSPVFVNVRLWPFMSYALFALAATGTGLLIRNLRAKELAAMAILITTLVYGIGSPNHVRDWAEWNYKGLERKPRWPVFENLVLPLRGTPGRLANDLHDYNHSISSTRVFECVPHITGKPILEGGIVNSALGSMFSYYVQGETSKNCAGFPNIVKPATFNFTNATKHLELFNVKHFIARWSETKAALDRSKEWRLISESQGWELYELMTHDGSYVFVPKNQPLAVRTENWKEAALEWIYAIDAINQPFALLRQGEKANNRFETILTDQEFTEYLSKIHNQESKIKNATLRSTSLRSTSQKSKISQESVTDNRIRFKTNAVGLPHIIKCSYYPNWKVRGARKVYMVTPCFMLVYPEQEEVELYYGYTLSDNVGRGLSLLGVIMLALAWWKKRTDDVQNIFVQVR